MNEGSVFRDYYKILEVDPSCNGKTLEASYRLLAKLYHPDHPETADVSRFNDVIQAYRALRDSDQRTAYDRVYSDQTGYTFSNGDEITRDEAAAVSDADVHAKMLRFLYKRRRENAQDAGIGRYFVQEMLNCSDEHYEFPLWYLKAKGFIETTEQGTLAITIEGVDHVISTSRIAVAAEKLLLARSDEPGQP